MKFSSKICIPIQATNMRSALREIKKASKKADIIEVWLDHIKDLDIEKLSRSTRKPLLFVNKGKKEKGKWSGSEKSRIELLVNAALVAKYLDVGIHTNPKFVANLAANKKRSKLIISFHDFQKTPSTQRLQTIVRKAKSLGADIVKIATYTRNHEESLRLLNLLESESSKGQKMIVLGMGKYGKLTRIAGCYLGNYLTFVPLTSSSASAPGQIPYSGLQKLKKLL